MEQAEIAVADAGEPAEQVAPAPVAAGLGVGIIPWIYVAGDIAAGRLAAPFGFVRTPNRFQLILPEQTTKRGLARFRDWLVEEAATVPPPPEMALVGA